ncbi:hypothetical protein SARC_13406 [Sphaeroforma arctica JP610]|uniref:Uncharacterized protein n=1 Tax=Sphaeroforma arctica JP610 TaxID=667725 RepID=A0A0L0FBC5_9EUKA|nr:hypothetical protein SARC_13406 [Sphaeroforma arctica JP610]KNC74037.1 hypothetical protein SARC_13406 [Sphaeroforma arctica JP610]|eukprot:XP_014147939.1 hypothetical protein SARC_13406 [Sphaeroforma arctica JP610]
MDQGGDHQQAPNADALRPRLDLREEAEIIWLEIEQRGYAVPGISRNFLFGLRLEITGVSTSEHINNLYQCPTVANGEWSTGVPLDICTAVWCQHNVSYQRGLSESPVATSIWYRGQKAEAKPTHHNSPVIQKFVRQNKKKQFEINLHKFKYNKKEEDEADK